MKRILLIEDDTWLAESYKRLLEQKGYEVMHVPDGEKAMGHIDTAAPDIVVADVLLEGSTIFTLLHELQSYDDTRRVPVILCSSLGTSMLKENELKKYGVKKILDKTLLTPEILFDTVQELSA